MLALRNEIRLHYVILVNNFRDLSIASVYAGSLGGGYLVVLDLREMTSAHLARARRNLGKNSYAAPCIIGVLMPAGQRALLDAMKHEDLPGCPPIDMLVEVQAISFADDAQLGDAVKLQNAFDRGCWDEVLEVAGPYQSETPPARLVELHPAKTAPRG